MYAAYHLAMVQMGHEMDYPAVIRARKELAWQWMAKTISTAESAPIQGVAVLD